LGGCPIAVQCALKDEVVRAYMGHVQDNAEASVRRVIGVLQDGACEYALDNGAVIRV
jgi:5-oxoprolinase (ATP-hydrolysing)